MFLSFNNSVSAAIAVVIYLWTGLWKVHFISIQLILWEGCLHKYQVGFWLHDFQQLGKTKINIKKITQNLACFMSCMYSQINSI
jgi:hypothetical protein